ncbi:MAG: penicillin-binding protein 2 [Candidatus Desulfofervidus auxilii]|nr:penicillin-binding protein 2 [Candidatus Desulfofervidus auxilii]
MPVNQNRILKKWQKRLIHFRLIVFCLLAVIGIRLAYLQLARGREYAFLAEKNRLEIESIPAARGIIYDRNGIILATNRPSFCLLLYPQKLPKNKKMLKLYASFLSSILQKDCSEVLKLIKKELKYPLSPVYLKKGLSWKEVAIIETRSYFFPALKITVIPLRFYPNGILASHLLGYVSLITPKQLKTLPDAEPTDFVGQSGLEKSYEKNLAGKKGKRYLEVDALGRIIRTLKEISPEPGNNLYLTLDANLQKKAEILLKRKKGAIVALDPFTGEILISASSPSYDPNLFVQGMDEKTWNKIKKHPGHPLENRVTAGLYPPGSLLKIVTAIAALEEKVISPRTKIYCSGRFPLGNRVFHCWKKIGHGWMDVKRAIIQSCDVFFYQLGLWLGAERLAQYAYKCGFGKLTGIEIKEAKGLVPNPTWYWKTKKTRWPEGETLNMSIGQGAFLATPLQLAQFFAAIANGGYIYKPKIVKKIVSVRGEIIKEIKPEIKCKLPISAKNLKIIRDAMIGVMNHPSGTGYHARSHLVTIAGKTGTAQLVSINTKNKLSIEDHAWFAGFAPAKNPKIVIVVLIEHGGKGGITAAPLARDLIEAYLYGKN